MSDIESRVRELLIKEYEAYLLYSSAAYRLQGKRRGFEYALNALDNRVVIDEYVYILSGKKRR